MVEYCDLAVSIPIKWCGIKDSGECGVQSRLIDVRSEESLGHE